MDSGLPPITIRLAQPSDVPAVYRMVRESAVEQGGEQDLCADPENLVEDGFRLSPPRFECLLAEAAGQPAGIALYYWTYSTWTSRRGVYIEDLYVAPDFLRRGVARSLMIELAKIAAAAGCRQMRWLVLRENRSAVRFYESLGAVASPDSFGMQLKGKTLDELAHQYSQSAL
jgi:GNAT superfamily N-acetyltransferase